MAGAGHKDFTSTILTASDVNTYLMQQTVMVFATSTARSTALPVPTEGMVSFLKDSNTFWYHDGSSWVNLGNLMIYATYAARANALPSPTEGMITWLQDVDELEVYNGTSWSRVVVTSDDEGISTTGTITAGSDITASGTAAASGVSVIARNSSTNGYSQLLAGSTLQGGAGIWRTGSANANYGGNNSLNIGTTGVDPVTICTSNLVRMTVSPAGIVTKPYQPYLQARGGGATGQWLNPNGAGSPLRNGAPAGFTWGEVYDDQSNFNPATGLFIAPVTGVYLCIFKTYQQNFSGNGYIHWMFEMAGATFWNSGSAPYNIYGFDRATYADGVDVAVMCKVGAGNSIGIVGIKGSDDERFYNDYTYFGIYLLG